MLMSVLKLAFARLGSRKISDVFAFTLCCGATSPPLFSLLMIDWLSFTFYNDATLRFSIFNTLAARKWHVLSDGARL